MSNEMDCDVENRNFKSPGYIPGKAPSCVSVLLLSFALPSAHTLSYVCGAASVDSVTEEYKNEKHVSGYCRIGFYGEHIFLSTLT